MNRVTMPFDALLELVLNIADIPSAPFGWNVEACDLRQRIKVGDPYLWFLDNTVTLRDIVENGDVRLTQQQFNRMRATVKSVDEAVGLNGVCYTEMFSTVGEIPEGLRPLWMLGLLSLNRFAEGHNWMLEFMNYVCDVMSDDSDIEIGFGFPNSYDFVNQEFVETYLEAIFEDDKSVLTVMYIDHPDYNEPPTHDRYADAIDNLRAEGHPILSPLYEMVDEEDDFIRLLAYTMDRVQDAYLRGDLELIATDSMPHAVKMFVNQLPLPF